MQVHEAIQKRLSIRRYTDDTIPAEHLDMLFKALQLAASANNYQNWEFVFVKEPELKQRLVPACSHQRFVRTAPISLPVWPIPPSSGTWWISRSR